MIARRPKASILLPAGLALLVLLAGACAEHTTARPGEPVVGTPDGATPPPRTAADRLRLDVQALHALGERSTRRPAALAAAAEHLEVALAPTGLPVARQAYEADGQTVANLELVLPGGGAPDTLVVGAHYDSAPGTPGADDNASGCAALLELARRLADRHASTSGFPRHTLRLVFFVNEEPPHFHTEAMGSLVHARALAARDERVAAMLSLECLGYYDTAPGSQDYPFPLDLLYPDTGDFLGFVGDTDSGDLVRRCVGVFRDHGSLPAEGVATFADAQGIDWSDHWSYWQIGAPAVMVTDTALFRNPHYHEPTDAPDTLDYERLARAVDGLEAVIGALDGDG